MNNNQKTTSICMIAAALVLFYLMSRKEGWKSKKATRVRKTPCRTDAANQERTASRKSQGKGACYQGYKKIGRRYCSPNKSKYRHVCMK